MYAADEMRRANSYNRYTWTVRRVILMPLSLPCVGVTGSSLSRGQVLGRAPGNQDPEAVKLYVRCRLALLKVIDPSPELTVRPKPGNEN